MKTLLVLRHAKAKNDAGSDQERALKKSGRKAAAFMGKLLRDENILPDVVLSSTAVRARETTELVADAAQYAGPFHFLDELYLAEPSSYLAALKRLAGNAERAMVVGHNPALEELVAMVTGETAHLPTAALAECSLSIGSWEELGPQTSGKLCKIWRAKEFLDD